VFLGEFERGVFAQRMAAGDEIISEMFERQRWDVIPGAEPAAELSARVSAAIEQVAATTGPDRTAVAVTHGGIIAEACAQVTRSEPFGFINVANASITRLVKLSTGRWTLQTFNETGHLDGIELPR
jgi:probable phosphoglycerate mutase